MLAANPLSNDDDQDLVVARLAVCAAGDDITSLCTARFHVLLNTNAVESNADGVDPDAVLGDKLMAKTRLYTYVDVDAG